MTSERQRIKSQFPDNVYTPILITDWLTIGDVARIGIPTLVLGLIAGIPGILIGVILGVGIVFIAPKGEKIDVLLKYYIGYKFDEKYGNWPKIEEIRDKTVIFSDGTVLGVVEVSPVDVTMLSETEQESNQDTIHDLVKEVDYPIEIHSKQSLEDLSRYQGGKNNVISTNHYILVKSRTKQELLVDQLPIPEKLKEYIPVDREVENIDDSVGLVEKRCSDVWKILNAGDMSATQITGTDLEKTLQKLHIVDYGFSPEKYRIQAGEAWSCRTLYISGYPREARIGWLADVLNIDGLIDTIQVSSPLSEKQYRRLDRMIGRGTAGLSISRNPRTKARLKRKIEDAEDMLDAESGGEKLLNYGVYITAKAKTDREAKEILDKIKSVLRRHRIQYQTPYLQTNKAIKTYSINSEDLLDKTLIVPGWSACTGFPFATQDKIEKNGQVFGTDTRNNSPIVLDRFSWDAAHIARMGKIGSGKSYAAKQSLLRSTKAYNDLNIHIVDPKKEYKAITQALTGETVILDKDNLDNIDSSSVTRYTVSDRSNDNTEHLAKAVRHIYREASKDSEKTIVLIDEAHRLLRDRKGRTVVGELIREGRDRNIGVTLITQNGSDFTRSQEGKDILKNVDCYVFMRHQEVNTGVVDFFKLSENEAVELRKLRTGTDLPFSESVIRGPVNTKLRIEATEKEHKTIENATN